MNVAAVYAGDKMLWAMLNNNNKVYVLMGESFLFEDNKLRNDWWKKDFCRYVDLLVRSSPIILKHVWVYL